jgi:protein TonB
MNALHWALGLSLAVHGALLTIRFVDPQGFQRLLADTPLEVILVNARSAEPPSQAQAIAQVNLAGGGDAAQGRATSPLPPATEARVGDAAEDARQRIERLQQEQMRLLARLQREATMLLAEMPSPGGTPQAQAERERRMHRVRQIAEIEQRIQEENARPRRRFVSPATREAVYAAYYDALRRRIEDRGTRDFPEIDGRKLYGELTMHITVDAAGRVVDTEIVDPSKTPGLNQRAAAIVRAAAPYGLFSAAMLRETDQLVVTARFRFTTDAVLDTSVGVAPSR